MQKGSWGLRCVLLALCLAGCMAKRVPVTETEQMRDADLEDLVKLLESRYRDIDTLKALVKVEAKTPEERNAFDGILFFKRPDRLRLQGFDLLGRTVFNLIAQGEEVRIHLPGEDRVLSEEIDSYPFFGRGKTPVKLTDMLEVLGASGGIFLDPAVIPALEKDQTVYILYLFYMEGSRAVLIKKLWLERVHFRLVREEIFNPDGQRRMTIFFDDYQKIADHWRPFKVRAEIQGAYEFSLDYSEIKVNPPLGADDFSMVRKGSQRFDSGGRSGEEAEGSSHAPRSPAFAPAEPDAHFLPGADASPASGLASDGPGRGGIESEASRPPH